MGYDYAEIDRLIAGYQKDHYFKQAAYAVFDREGILFQNVIGGINADAVFDLASLTKLYTTTILLRFIEEGQIRLDGRLCEYLSVPPHMEKLQKCFAEITVRQLLTHTSGLMAWYPFYAQKAEFYEILEKILELPLQQNQMVYSDLNYMLLGMIVEKAAGCTLPEAVEKYIRRPLGIDRLCYCVGRDHPEWSAIISSYDNMPEEHMCEERGIVFDGFRPHGVSICGEANDGNCWYYFGGISGHAGLFSDLAGVCRLGMFYLNTREKTFVEAQQEAGYSRGLGFQRGEMYPNGCGHTGYTGTSLYISSEHGVGAVLLTNRLTCATEGALPDLTRLRSEFHREALLCAGI